MTIRLLVVDDHEVVRSGIATILAGTEIEIVGEAADQQSCLEQALLVRPDVVLLDVRLEAGDGLSALSQLKQESPASAVLMLSTYDNPTYIGRASSLGADGYLLKGCSRMQLLEAIRKVARGGSAWQKSPSRRGGAKSSGGHEDDDLQAPLTPRESEVLRQLAGGASNKEIAQSLTISVETVKEHVQHITTKLGVNGRTQAAVWAARQGLV